MIMRWVCDKFRSSHNIHDASLSLVVKESLERFVGYPVCSLVNLLSGYDQSTSILLPAISRLFTCG